MAHVQNEGKRVRPSRSKIGKNQLNASYNEGIQQGLAQAHRQQVEFEAKRDSDNPTADVVIGTLARSEIGEPSIVIHMSAADARNLQAGFADLLCWVNGFKAAIPDDTERHPGGIGDIRRMSLAILDGIAKARGYAAEPVV